MLEQGPNFVGFRFFFDEFLIVDDQERPQDFIEVWLNGWARFDLEGTELTISEWAYDNEFTAEWTGENQVNGKSIHVGAVPAPPAAIPALTLLALGATGLRRMRRRGGQTITEPASAPRLQPSVSQQSEPIADDSGAW